MNTPVRQFFILSFVIFLFASTGANAQKPYDPATMKPLIKKYSEKAAAFLKEGKPELAGPIEFDTIPELLLGLQLDNYALKDLEGNIYRLYDLDQAVVFHMATPYCKPCLHEIPAVNAAAKKFKKKVKTFIITQMPEKDLKPSFYSKYNNDVIVIPEWEDENNSQHRPTINDFKHLLAFPTSYYLDKNMVIRKVTRGAAGPQKNQNGEVIMSEKEAFRKNLNRIKAGIKKILN